MLSRRGFRIKVLLDALLLKKMEGLIINLRKNKNNWSKPTELKNQWGEETVSFALQMWYFFSRLLLYIKNTHTKLSSVLYDVRPSSAMVAGCNKSLLLSGCVWVRYICMRILLPGSGYFFIVHFPRARKPSAYFSQSANLWLLFGCICVGAFALLISVTKNIVEIKMRNF